MKVFRLSRKKYGLVLSGKGAAITGNRWNSKGTEIIYCGHSRALAMAEVAVHLTLATLPDDYQMLEIEIPDQVEIEEFPQEKLPPGWNSWPHSHESKKIGDDFVIRREKCVLKIPSAVVKGDFNFLINPFHPDFSQIKVISAEDFPFDPRLFS